MKGKAAVFKGPDIPFEIMEFPLPEVKPGAILVRVNRANICGSDIHQWKGGGSRAALDKPLITGHEMVGQVYELGAGVDTDSAGQPIQVGDRITYSYFSPCGHCYQCLHGQPHACPNSMRYRQLPIEEPPHFIGAFAEYYYIFPNNYVFKVPDEVSDELAAPANCALAQVYYGLHQVRVMPGDTVVIQGAGGLGINSIAIAREMGAATIIVVEQYDDRIELAKAFGADHIIDMKQYGTPRERVRQVRQITAGRGGADIVAELTGIPEVAREGIGMVRAGGKYLWIGNINLGQTLELDPSAIVLGNRTIVGMGVYEPWALYRALDLLKRTRNKYPFDRIISHTFKLEEINTAFEMASQRKVTRASLVP